jgi:hypothetical protein
MESAAHFSVVSALASSCSHTFDDSEAVERLSLSNYLRSSSTLQFACGSLPSGISV